MCLCYAALSEFPQSVLMLGITPNQVQHLALGIVKLKEVLMSQLLKFVQVAQDSIPSFCWVKCTAWLHVICKLAEGPFDLTLVIDEDIKERQSQNGALMETITDLHVDVQIVDPNFLAVSLYPIPYPLNNF